MSEPCGSRSCSEQTEAGPCCSVLGSELTQPFPSVPTCARCLSPARTIDLLLCFYFAFALANCDVSLNNARRCSSGVTSGFCSRGRAGPLGLVQGVASVQFSSGSAPSPCFPSPETCRPACVSRALVPHGCPGPARPHIRPALLRSRPSLCAQNVP